MNFDQIQGIMRVTIAGLATLAAKKGWIPMIRADEITSDIVSIISIVWMAVLSHKHIGKVTAAAILAVFCLFSPMPAGATDVARAAAPNATNVAACATQTQCTGAYAYAGLGGNGTNLDILGSGLSGSVFQNGAEFLGGAGYEYWSGGYLLAVEFGGSWLVPASAQAVATKDRAAGEILFHAGVALGNLFGTPAATTTTFQALAARVMSPYGIAGIRCRDYGCGFATGAGLQYYIGPGVTLSPEYLHVDYNDKTVAGVVVHTDNTVRLRFEKHFTF